MQMSSLSMSSTFSGATDQAQKPLSHDSSGRETRLRRIGSPVTFRR
jgi:hypothetical protein